MPVFAILLQGAAAILIALSGTYGQILSYVVSVDFILFGLTGAALFVFRRRDAGEEGLFRAPGHPFTTAFFVAACAVVVAATVWNHPRNSLIGFAILARGRPRLPLLAAKARDERRCSPTICTGRRTSGRSRYALGSSEVPHFRMDRWPIDLAELELDGASHYRYPPLRAAIAAQMRRDAGPAW